MIQVQNLEKSFSQGLQKVPVLKNISMRIPSSQTLSIVGPSGSGKTTLLSLLAGLEKPDRGEIQIHDQLIHQMNESELTQFRAEHIGIVFQQHYLMPHLTALENVKLPLEIAQDKKADEKAKEILSFIGLSHRLDHFPYQMSGGECQRIALARACVIRPHILLADEPTGNLDIDSGNQVTQLLFSLVQEFETTLILVTHNLDLAKKCQMQTKMVNGTLEQIS